MRVLMTEFEGLLVFEPKIFKDNRGFFYETFQADRYREHIQDKFVQDNFSHSVKNTIRGLHYQIEQPQGKLVYVVYGSVLDVAVDIRISSRTFGKVFTQVLNAEEGKQIYLPKGFAHGFCVLSETAGFVYKCTDYYNPSGERGIIWNDKELNIPWPTQNPIMSEKDLVFPSLKDISKENLFL